MAVSTAAELPSVIAIREDLRRVLDLAREVKPETTVDPPLPVSSIAPAIIALQEGLNDQYDQAYRFGTIETVAREIFYARMASTTIDQSDFVEVWNLLDVLLIGGDKGVCAPELVCWLIEELLDSQTTIGCRTVFDYLESRRQRLAAKDFHKKNLVFLRSCNELLRRLSRAEDAIFCGRVFFFLFQTFPLGDKSSVNLRGEFHSENVTKFEDASQIGGDGNVMDVDTPKTEPPAASTRPSSKDSKSTASRSVKKPAEEEVLSNSALYPIFWRLQQDFCEPARLFLPENFATFKKGLAHTIRKFKATSMVPQSHTVEDGKRGTKRKADGETMDDFADNYNPKYLTSRKLFDLEVSDLAFQRHIMVQALILIDFLLSLTEKAKKRQLAVESANKSMLYAFTLSEEDSTWANTTRSNIITYLQSFGDGRFYCRMVETVLTRDKNWVRWKVEGCPSIVRDPVSTESLLVARKELREAVRPRRIPPKPMGSMDFSFLEKGYGGGLDALKDPARFTAPTINELINGMRNDELDLDFADEDEAVRLKTRMDNKKWRIVQQLRETRLGLLDKLEPGKEIGELSTLLASEHQSKDAETEAHDDDEDAGKEEDADDDLVKDQEEGEQTIDLLKTDVIDYANIVPDDGAETVKQESEADQMVDEPETAPTAGAEQ